jgi:hypothetical protein
VFTHEIITTCETRRGLFRRSVVTAIVTPVEAHDAEELGRITRAVLTAIDEAVPRAYVTSRPQPITLPRTH